MLWKILETAIKYIMEKYNKLLYNLLLLNIRNCYKKYYGIH